MRIPIIVALIAGLCSFAPDAAALDGEPPVHEDGFGEFHVRLVIEDVIRHDVFLPRGLNLGRLAVSSYKSGSDAPTGPVLVPGDLSVTPVTVEIGWDEASPLIRWFKRVGEGRRETRDVELYVRHVHTQKNHVHVTLHDCWPSEVSLGPAGDRLPPVLVTLQVERVTTHLPPLLQMMEGQAVGE